MGRADSGVSWISALCVCDVVDYFGGEGQINRRVSWLGTIGLTVYLKRVIDRINY